MILEKDTFEKYGYYPSQIAPRSSKSIVVECDYCLEVFNSIKKRVVKAREYVEKDACKKCRFKKRADISLVKYGVDNVSKLDSVKEKISKKNSDRLKSDEYKEQVKKTMLDKYGAESAMHVKEFSDKQKETLRERYGVENPMHIPGLAKEAAEKMKATKIEKGIITLYDGKTIPEIADEKGCCRSHMGKVLKKHGERAMLDFEKTQTSLEMFMSNMLDSNNIDYETQVRINKKIADFVLPNKIVVECDGLYWHCDLHKDKKYHMEKRQAYIDAGFRPFFFRGDEIRNKMPIVSSIILNALGKSKPIYARKCNIVEGEYHSFLDENHLMSKGRGRCFGLEYNGSLVSTLQIKKIKEKHYEVSRFCHAKGVSVVGGFSRLLKYAEKNIDMDSLKTYIDMRYGLGDYLSSFGFKSNKTYPSFKWTDGVETFHRLLFKGRTGYRVGLQRIWDCGQKPWIKNYGV